jgi:hypothetical protein
LTKKQRHAIIIIVRGTKEALEIKERETAKEGKDGRRSNKEI